jgi:ribosomal protein S12 methylthiotransferase
LKKRTRINIITLGCAKNLVDSEVLMRQLDESGFQIVHNSDNFDAGTVLINTCGFINDAKQESIDAILRYAKAKKDGQVSELFVFGCLSQRYMSELKKEIPEVDGWFGVNDFQRIINELGGNWREELYGARLLSTPSHYAYLKISEGCDRLCSFCAIPMIRGKQRSRTIDDLTAEARYLAKKGVKELILIAQDLTAHGTDIYGRQTLPELLEELTGIEEFKWIRLHYAYPASFPMKVLDLMAEKKQICNYLDLPFQHISDKVLAKMHRGTDRSDILDFIRKIRNTVPGIALRTTLLVGHPGEDENAFSELLDFVKSQQFERLGVFAYSEEEGTFAAKHYKDTIPQNIKNRRVKEIMEIQMNISLNINNKKVGQIYNILIDSREGQYAVGRTESDSPDIDNEVLVKDQNKKLEPGKFYRIRITGAENYDLYGEIAGKSSGIL